MTSQLFGFHISPNGTSEAQIREIVRKSGARTHTVLHSAGLANAVYQEAQAGGVEDPIIILRADWPDQEWWKAPFNDPDTFVRDRKALVGGHLYLQYLNEPVVTNTAQLNDLLGKCIAFMDACERHGVKGSVGGFADASLFQQAWVEAGLFDAFLTRAVDWTRAGHGVINHHDYSEGCPMANGGGKSEWDMLDPAKMQPSSWPTARDMQEPTPDSWLAFSAQDAGEADYDFEIATEAAKFLISERGLQPRYDSTRALFVETHGMDPMAWLMSHFIAFGSESNWTAMRYMWPLRRARKLKSKGYRFVVGEYGPQDDMPHLRVNGFTQQLEARAAGGRKLRGPLEQADFYAFWWPQWSRERAHMEILRWQARVVPAECDGYTFFALNEDSEWRSFNYLRWAAFWPAFYALVSELRSIPSVTTYPASVPKPANAGAGERVRLRTNSYINVRDAPTTGGKLLSPAPRNKALMTVYPGGTKQANGFTWYWVEVDGGPSGWQALVYEYPYQQWVTPEPVAKTFLIPAQYDYVISSRFNDARSYGKHEGLDMASKASAPKPRLVVAGADGVVEKVVTNDPAYGVFVRIYHGDGWRTYSAHLEKALVTVGQTVKEGQAIGHEGSTGNSTGPHLHFTVQHYGDGLSGYVVEEVVDPAPLLRAAPVPEPEMPLAWEWEFDTLQEKDAFGQFLIDVGTNVKAAPGRRVYVTVTTE